MVVQIGADGRDAVPERAERREARGAEERLAVGVLGAEGEPQTTQISLSVRSAASARSRASLSLIGGNGPVIGQIRTPMDGSWRIDSMILGPRQSPTGWPPLSIGFATLRYSGIHWCSSCCFASDSEGRVRPARVARSAKWAPVPPDIE